jgi:hypothetical protein
MRRVQFFILDADFVEVLLGCPLMQLLGTDVAAQLNTVLEEFYDRDSSDLFTLGALVTLEAGDTEILARAIMLSTHGAPGPVHHNIPPDFPASEPKVIELARLHQSASSASHRTEEDFGGIPETPSLPIGEDAPGAIYTVLAKRVDVALENGMSPEGAATLQNLLIEYEDIFALKFSKQPPFKFKLLQVPMPADVRPICARPRPLPAAKRALCRRRLRSLQSTA